MNGYENFQDRLCLDNFKNVAAAGPIVSFDIASLRSDGFLKTSQGVKLVTLKPEDLGNNMVQEKSKMLFGLESVIIEREDVLDEKKRDA